MILFIDDEKRYILNYIEELEAVGFDVKYINNIDAALLFVKSEEGQKIQSLILDVMMPSGNTFTDEETGEDLNTGIEFYKTLRKIYPKMKVFILTNVTRENVREFFEKEANCYFISKSDGKVIEFAQMVKNEIS